jgi:hypothetical protein
MSLEYHSVLNFMARGSKGSMSWEGRTFWHIPGNKIYQYQNPAEMKFISLILCFSAVEFQLVHQVLRPVHLKALRTLPCEVNYKTDNLGMVVLSY